MTTETATAPLPLAAGDDGTPCHLWCCDPRLALCGQVLDEAAQDDDDFECVVCLDLLGTCCP